MRAKQLLIVGILLFSVNAAFGQGNIVLLSKDWMNVTFLQGHVVIHGTRGFKPNENLVENVDWKEDADGHFFRRVRSERYGKQEWDFSSAFDGINYYTMDQTGSGPSQMQVAKKVPRMVPNFYSEFFPLDPYKFLIETGTDNNTRFPGIRDMASFVKLTGSANFFQRLQAATFQGKPALSTTFPGGKNWEGKQISYLVYFAAANSHELLGWECVYPNKTLYSSLVVTGWKAVSVGPSNVTIPYPSQYTCRYYSDSSSPEQGISYEYSAAVTLDPVPEKIDQAEFAIDPAQADYIYDRDSHKQIHNPK